MGGSVSRNGGSASSGMGGQYAPESTTINFKYSASVLSYTFFECPFKCLTYKDFVTFYELEDEEEDRILYDYYEEYLHQCDVKEHPAMIRYDLDFKSYLHGIHPVSHMHIGSKTQVRLGLDRILSPKSFTSFILRQNYPALWKSLIQQDDDWVKFFIKEKSILPKVEKKYWDFLDNSELHLA